MYAVEITQEDIASLGQKLSSLEPTLTEPERVLLLFMLSLAGEAVNLSRTGSPAGTQAPPDGDSPAGAQAPPDGDGEPAVVVLTVGERPAPSIREQFATAFTPGAAGAAGAAGPLAPSIGPGPA